MAIIKVTLGGCGISIKDANGNMRHVLKTPEDGPFECDDKHAESLVKLGRAEYVGKRILAESIFVPGTDSESDKQEESGNLTGHMDAAELETWDYNDLKKLAADMGVKPEGQKKADYIAAIVAVEVEIEEAAIVEDDDELPDLSAADPE